MLNGKLVTLTSALDVAEKELMGTFRTLWPLTKILDIGGVERTPNYSTRQSKQQRTTCTGKCVHNLLGLLQFLCLNVVGLYQC